jgi:LuxR family transcriptional regulator, quorum-sensing system regulator BjaR1
MMQAAFRSGKIALEVFDTLESIQTANGCETVLNALAKGLAKVGIEYFLMAGQMCEGGKKKRVVLGDRAHREGSRHYFGRRYENIDPALREAAKRASPVFWSEVRDRPDLTAQQRRIYPEQAAFGMNEGICVPLFGRDPVPAIVNCAGLSVDTGVSARLGMQAMTIFAYHCLIRHRGLPAVRRSKLTAREVECLNWAAQGKTDWEIGEILSLSECTVHWYVECAKRKLGARTRIQAVVGAIHEGAIGV